MESRRLHTHLLRVVDHEIALQMHRKIGVVEIVIAIEQRDVDWRSGLGCKAVQVRRGAMRVPLTCHEQRGTVLRRPPEWRRQREIQRCSMVHRSVGP